MYGKSTSKNRDLVGVGCWINLFEDMRDKNVYNESGKIHVESLKICFMHMYMPSLTELPYTGCLHDIRQQKNMHVPRSEAYICTCAKP